LHNGNFKELVKEVLAALTFELKVGRAGFWAFQQKKKEITNIYLYDKKTEAFTGGHIFSQEECPKFFEIIQSKLVIKIDDAFNSIVTKEIKDSYIGANGVKSILGMQVWHKEVILGIIFVEHTEEMMKWSTHDKIYLTTASSYISQSYSSQLRIKETGLRQLTEANYHSVFNDSPYPMLIYDPETWYILDANNYAVSQYGYSLDQFKQLNLMDLRSHQKNEKLDVEYQENLLVKWKKTHWLHHKSDGSDFIVEISGDATTYIDKKARIAVVLDVTKEKKEKEDKERVLHKLEDYAFYASHNVRRPISSILGILDLIKISWDDRDSYEELMANLQIATMDLDEVIRVMNAKLELD
jgi:PAS domain S-box-containing protein